MLKCLNLQGGCWLLVLSRDIGLGVALSQMGPVGTNVTLGLTDVDDQQMDIVTKQAMQVVSGVNLMCHLGRMQWDKRRAWVGMCGESLLSLPSSHARARLFRQNRVSQF